MSRPIGRPPSLSRNSSSASVTSGQSLGSSRSRPSLLIAGHKETLEEMPWKVHDALLKPIPAFYPPMNPRCAALITDASPSMVAARISHALATRSISVEYDDENQIATCMTVDRVHFSIHLWRGHKAPHSIALDGVDAIPDFSHAVIVEVVRTRGSVISFHRSCQAILMAAMSYSSGEDKRKPYQTSSLEFPRVTERSEDSHIIKRAALCDPRSQAVVEMEHAVALLKKDRIGAQQHGMESLINLTDVLCCGPELATHVSLTVLGRPSPNRDGAADDHALKDVHTIIFQLIRDRMLPGEVEEVAHGVEASFQSSTDTNKARTSITKNHSSTSAPKSIPIGNEIHGGLMRSMALRVLTNALTTLNRTQHARLRTIIAGSALESRAVLQALAEDLLGASRPPAVVAGTRLASAHDATLVMKCLKLIAENSTKAQTLLVNPKNLDHPILNTLLRAKHVHHAALQREAMEAHDALSQDVRTC